MSLSNLNTEQLNEVISSGVSSAMSVFDTILDSKIKTSCNKNSVKSIENIDYSVIQPAMYFNIVFSGDVQGKAVALFRVIDLSIILNFLTSNENDDVEFDEMSLGMLNEIMTQLINEFSKKISEELSLEINASISGLMDFTDASIITSLFECSETSDILIKRFQYEISSILKGQGCFCFSKLFIKSISNTVAIEESDLSDKNNEAAHPSYNSSKFKTQENIDVHSPVFPTFSSDDEDFSPFANENINLLMDVPVNVCVEIGKTKKRMREVMNYTQGSVILLDKHIGDPVDITVNGQIIARGDVIVIDNNFGVRITELVSSKKLKEKM